MAILTKQPGIIRNVLKDYFADGYAVYPGVGKVTDKEIAEFTLKHMTLFDKLFHPKKVAIAAQISQNLLFRVYEMPKAEKWTF